MITLNSQGGRKMLGEGWLPLNDYSAKYYISISTLRRRIRSGQIEHRFRDGKYWIKDKPMARAYHTTKIERPTIDNRIPTANDPTFSPNEPTYTSSDHIPATNHSVPDERSTSHDATQHLVAELKSAYVQILQEKEEQILLLKEEVADLKTLVRILESQNAKNKSLGLTEAPAGEWMDEPLES